VLALDNATGERIRLEGRVIDGDGNPINDALVEISQPDGEGRYPQTPDEARALGFRAFGRVGTGTDRRQPLRVPHRQARRGTPGEAPHINVIVLMRGLLLHAFTRVYFSDEAAANAKDAVLQSVPADRRHTLVAERVEQGGAVTTASTSACRATDETAFFDV
jgi:protocatechuate 3,4-dioxygenase alpha subunit